MQRHIHVGFRKREGGGNPEGGGANLLFLPFFPDKVHENEKKCTGESGGGGVRSAPWIRQCCV